MTTAGARAARGGPGADRARASRSTRTFARRPIFWPQLLGLHAEACALAGRTAAAFDLVDEAAGFAAEGTWDSAVLKLQKADLLVSSGDVEQAEAILTRACDEAAGVHARMIQLQAATRLARLAAASGRSDRVEPLREVYATFTEGFETPALVEARALLGA